MKKTLVIGATLIGLAAVPPAVATIIVWLFRWYTWVGESSLLSLEEASAEKFALGCMLVFMILLYGVGITVVDEK